MNAEFEKIVRSIGEVEDSVVIDETRSFEADLGVDSLKLLDIIGNVEAEFGVEIEMIHRFPTVGDLWQHVESLMAGVEA